jgi:hypothetical protein
MQVIKYRATEIRNFKRQALDMIMSLNPKWTDSMLGAALGLTSSGAGCLRRGLGIPPANPQLANHRAKSKPKPRR